MNAETPIPELVERIRGGDPEAAAELVQRYEPEIRRAVRVRLTDPRLRRIVDSVDICQSILGNFFVRAASGEFELEEPGELFGLLVTMARNRVTDWARWQQAARRDVRREIPAEKGGEVRFQIPSSDPSATRQIAGRELLAEVDRRLEPGEKQLMEMRRDGQSWKEIAAELGEQPDALRKRLSRAMDRVTREIESVS